MIRVLLQLICLLALVFCSGIADAQIVRIGRFGGVSVRAPFVGVDVLPYGGGTRVRAPFTRVYTGGYRYGAFYGGYYPSYFGYYPSYYGYYPSYYGYYGSPAVVYGSPLVYAAPPVTPYEPAPAYPPVAAAAPVVSSEYPLADTGTLAIRLRAAAARLAQSLSLRRSDADVWLEYLGPELIVDTIDQGGDPSNLRRLVANYDGVVGNGSLGSIRSAGGFAETRSLLKQYVASAGTSVAKPAVTPPLEPQEHAPAAPTPSKPAASAAEAPVKPTPRASADDTSNDLNPFREPTDPQPKTEETAPLPPPPAMPDPPEKPAPPQAKRDAAPAKPIKTATGAQVPTPL